MITPAITPDKRGINKCAPEIIALVIEQFLVCTAALPGAELLQQMRTCSLVARSWRYSAQRALHRVVLVTPRNYQAVFRGYDVDLAAMNAGISGNIWRFPRSLFVRWDPDFPIKDLLRFPEFLSFMQRLGLLLTEFSIENCSFYSFENVINLLRLFPSIRSLRVEGCSFGVTSIQQANARARNAPSACPSLRELILGAEPDYIYNYAFDLLAFATWMMREPREQLEDVDILVPFHCSHEFQELTGTILRCFGRSLVGATLLWDFRHRSETSVELPSAFPDFSANRNLKTLTMDLFTQGTIIPSFLPSIVTSLNSPAFKQLCLTIECRELEDTPLGFMDLDSVVGALQRKDRFPSLKTVEFGISNRTAASGPWTPIGWEVFHQKVAPLRRRKIHIKGSVSHLGDRPDESSTKNSSYDSLDLAQASLPIYRIAPFQLQWAKRVAH